jgi:predicted permease
METLLQDLRYGARMLLKKPGFTLIAVITLGLGIGANTAIFSVVNGVLLRPLPFKEAGQLVALGEMNPKIAKDPMGASLPNFTDWQERNQAFSFVAGYRSQRLILTGEDEPLTLKGQSVSSTFFSLLAVDPVLGRTFSPKEEQAGQPKVAVLSYGFWQHHFGQDANIIGRSFTLNDQPYTIIGVMPAGFRFLQETDVWTPLEVPAALRQMRGARFLRVIARLKSDVSLAQAQAGMTTVTEQMAEQYPETNFGWGASVESLQKKLVGGVEQGLLILLGTVALVLLIACANVANLLLARGAARQREIAIRVALGAGRARVIRLLLVESTLLAVLGGGLGLLLALWGTDALRALSPATLPRLDEIQLDSRVLAFTLMVALLTGLLFGLAPVQQAVRINLQEVLKEGGRSLTRRRPLLRSLLVVFEIALSLVLLIGAGLLSRSFMSLMAVKPGFQPENLLTLDVSLPQYKYKTDSQQANFFQELLSQAESLPGVQSVALTSNLPLSGSSNKNSFGIEGGPADVAEWADLQLVSSDYFRTMGIALLKGRPFTAQDKKDAPKVAVINEAMARRFWPDEDPIGKRLLLGNPTGIVGVVGNVMHAGLDAPVEPEIYLPFSQTPSSVTTLVARTDSEPIKLAAALRAQVNAIDQYQPVENIRTMEAVVSGSVAQPRFVALAMGAFAGLALALATVGIYGVMSYSISQRTHEIGIRMALGAKKSDVLKLVIGQGMLIAGSGVAIGLAVAFALTRLMSSLLFGVSATDPITFMVLALFLTGVALGACLVPARRATKVDPMVALRYE